ncbi:hypothetical protein ACN27G_27565 [Plantactinospora sp. WMMB334]|uniref:hypothetical protein n=1 Tax=Plantactinospora sp. WMMB334 TaxID=3404119 RepID=UPI003B9360D5
MDVLAGLLGAAIGGLLVLAGDFVRRRAESRRDQVRALAEVAIAFSVQYGRHVGNLREALRGGVAASGHPTPFSDRYEASTRFFMTPGSEELRDAAVTLIHEYQRLDARSPAKATTDTDFGPFSGAQKIFEAQVREIVARGHVMSRRRLRPSPASGGKVLEIHDG